MGVTGKILVIDDEPEALENCRRILTRLRYDCITESDSTRVVGVLQRERPGLVLTDLCMPGMDGMGVLAAVKQHDPSVLVVLLTAYATVETAVRSMRQGAFDYLTKPFSRTELEEVVSRVFDHCTENSLSVIASPTVLRQALPAEQEKPEKLVGESSALREVLALVQKIAPTTSNVLIVGESGTGKEVIARTIHALSQRRAGPFIPVDCASLPETLLESELFGHEKGSFTGAHVSRKGLFELANGGTVFLDEVGGMSPPLQARLLRVLQERQIRPVGASRFLDIDVRVIAASNQNIEEACRRGEFREDLYYRMNVITIKVPSLRERVEDIRPLAKEFLRRCAVRNHSPGSAPVQFDPPVLEVMEHYHWPGNVRELQNAVERAVALADGQVIQIDHLPERIVVCRGGGPRQATMSFRDAKQHVIRSFERAYLLNLLKRFNGHMGRVAREAAVDRKTIERMVKRHRLRALL